MTTEPAEPIADASDLATAHEQMFLKSALQVRKPEGPAPVGRCLNCDATVPAGVRWCDEDCRHDWERFEAHDAERG